MQLSLVTGSEIFTAGYQGRALEAFVRLSVDHGITLVVDVRAHASSRRPGFAKTPLKNGLAAAGIGYVHLPIAGNPFRHDEGDWHGKYEAHLDHDPEIVRVVAEAARGKAALLVCFEREPKECHRTPLAERVAKVLGVKVRAL